MMVYVVVACWAAFMIYWIASSFSQKQVEERPITLFKVLAQFLYGFAFVLLIRPDWFHISQIPVIDSPGIALAGALICILGLFICIWARRTIAGNWSNSIDFKKGHELVISGPYMYVRHPIYSGYLLMFIGTMLVIGNLGGFIGLALLLVGTVMRIFQEERLMTRHFRDVYPEYKKKVKALVPFII